MTTANVLLRLATLFVASTLTRLLEPGSATAEELAPCALESGPTTEAPSRKVTVSILSVTVSNDVDEDVLVFTDRADIFGRVTIDGQVFDLPRIDGTDSPHWDDTNGRFEVTPNPGPVRISIDIFDQDGGLNGDRDVIDVSPVVGKRKLEVVFDPCSLRVGGDVGGFSQGVITAHGDSKSGSLVGVIRFKVEMADGRPATMDDVALVDLDLIQVVSQTPVLIANKPTVVMVRLASNATTDTPAHVDIRVSGPFQVFSGSFPIDPPLRAGEVRKAYFFVDNPMRFEATGAGFVAVTATLVPENAVEKLLSKNDCRRANNEVGNFLTKSFLTWTIVPTEPPHLKWLGVGTLLDTSDLFLDVFDDHFDRIRHLGNAYIETVFPIADLPTTFGDTPIVLPITAGIDFVATFLSAIDIPVDAATPFLFVFELNGVGGLVNLVEDPDVRLTLMGVLPQSGWFDRISFDLWEGVNGLSLGEFMHNGVIFLPRQDSVPGEEPGPALTLPGHELAHTYGLSTDPRLKGVFCGLDDPILGPLLCAAFGGLDEYKNDDPALQNGNPARGFWVPQGGEPAELLPLAGTEQCDSRCLMGPAPQNQQDHWKARQRWIDAADYEHLIGATTLAVPLLPDAGRTSRAEIPAGLASRAATAKSIAYVSGMIDDHDRVFFGDWHRMPNRAGRIDRGADSPGLYGLRFLDTEGHILQEIGVPISWPTLEGRTLLPVTAFGLMVPFPPETAVVQVRNRLRDAVLAERAISANAPEVYLRASDRKRGVSVKHGMPLRLTWRGRDRDRDPLKYGVLLSTDDVHWSPAAYGLTKHRAEIDASRLQAGRYFARIVASDGINTTVSESLRVLVDKPA